MGNGESWVSWFSVDVIKQHCQNHPREEKGLFWFVVPRDRVHHGGKCVVEEPGD